MQGYKVFKPDWTCRGFQYEVGKTYKHEGEIELCESGFHFCKELTNCFNYYSFNSNNKVAEVEAIGKIINGKTKSVTDEITILRELTWYEVLDMVNTGKNCTGMRNTGNSNTGNENIGDWNTGDFNEGFRNTGDWNTGDFNCGNNNIGDDNTGNLNKGHGNTGTRNKGNKNTGNKNIGSWNTGNGNFGDFNTGDFNIGDFNTGDFNEGKYNCGAFNTIDSKITLFNKPSELTYDEWCKSGARYILVTKCHQQKWIPMNDMTNKEKEENQDWEQKGGYYKILTYREMFRDMWENLTEEEKQIIKDIPNFDAEIFKEITGIDVEEDI